MKKIPLTRGKVALVDDDDFDWISQLEWSAVRVSSGTGEIWYATKRGGKGFMHSVISGFRKCDHKDGNGLNNQRDNLRPCTSSQNAANSFQRKPNISGFKGVSRNHYKWKARLMLNRKEIFLGDFDTPELAARAYDAGAIKHFGEFARTNFQ